MRMLSTLTTLAFVFLGGDAIGAVPPHLLVQGRLLDLVGEPVEGTYALSFTLYAEAEAVTKVYEETFPAVTVHEGVFSAVLGADEALDPATFDLHEALFVQIEVDGVPVGVPMPLASVAYAMKAQTAEVARLALGVVASAGPPVECDLAARGRFFLSTGDGLIRFCTGSVWAEFTGPQGPQGTPGTEGLMGPAGLDGAKGDKGDAGVQGLPGLQGVPGPKGDSGSPGVQGLKGDTGGSGPEGPVGPQGPAGPVGDPVYTVWGAALCGPGTAALYTGHMAALWGAGTATGSFCLDDAASLTWANWDAAYVWRAFKEGGVVGQYADGPLDVTCAVCLGKSYVHWGSQACSPGWTKVYHGWVGSFVGLTGPGTVPGTPVCLHASASGGWKEKWGVQVVRAKSTDGDNWAQTLTSQSFGCAVCVQ